MAILCSSAMSGDRGGGDLLGGPTPLVPFKTPVCPAGQCRPQPWPLALPGANPDPSRPEPCSEGPLSCLWSRGVALTDGETKKSHSPQGPSLVIGRARVRRALNRQCPRSLVWAGVASGALAGGVWPVEG